MSADSHTVCPRCASAKGVDLTRYGGPAGLPLVPGGVVDHAAEEHGLNRSVRENVDYYVQAVDGHLQLVFSYRADCWDCGWHYDTELTERIPA